MTRPRLTAPLENCKKRSEKEQAAHQGQGCRSEDFLQARKAIYRIQKTPEKIFHPAGRRLEPGHRAPVSFQYALSRRASIGINNDRSGAGT